MLQVHKMCKKGDIILIESYKDNGIVLPKHSFVVLEDKGGEIRGCDFDIIALAMSSLKNKDQSHRKLSYPGNFPISASEQEISGGGNNKNGYVKCDQFYFFKKELIEFNVIGQLADGVFEIILDYINELISKGIEFSSITENLA